MNKETKYQSVQQAFEATLNANLPKFVHMNNLCALLKKEFGFFWVGFYMNKDNGKLQLGPYQGELACFDITIGKGVCGTAAATLKSQIVADVHQFEGYIACHPEPNSEIVVPAVTNSYCPFVLDIDHIEKNYFEPIDQLYLEKLCHLIIQKLA